MKTRVIGLTGGIASGKSTVSAMLRELGAPIVDADVLAREAVEPGSPALETIRQQFGPTVIRADGRLDRAKLSELVFSDSAARDRLNAIVHPEVAERSGWALEAIERAGARIAIYDAALIVENGLAGALDGLIVVWVPESVQCARLMKRDGIDASAATRRIRAQMPLDRKVALADWLIDNSGSLDETRLRVGEVWQEIQSRYGG